LGKEPRLYLCDVDPQEIIPFTGTHPAIIHPGWRVMAAEHHLFPTRITNPITPKAPPVALCAGKMVSVWN